MECLSQEHLKNRIIAEKKKAECQGKNCKAGWDKQCNTSSEQGDVHLKETFREGAVMLIKMHDLCLKKKKTKQTRVAFYKISLIARVLTLGWESMSRRSYF